MPDGKLTISEFATKIKDKYPQYKDIDDSTLTEKILAKYPQYREQVELKKKIISGNGISDLGNGVLARPKADKPALSPQKPTPSPEVNPVIKLIQDVVPQITQITSPAKEI